MSYDDDYVTNEERLWGLWDYADEEIWELLDELSEGENLTKKQERIIAEIYKILETNRNER